MRGLSSLSCIESTADCVAQEAQSMLVLHMDRLRSALQRQSCVV